MGVGRELGKGHDNEMLVLEQAFNAADPTELDAFRDSLNSGMTVMAATAALFQAVAARGKLPGAAKLVPLLGTAGKNWFGPDHHWLEPCTPPTQIQDRMRQAYIRVIDLGHPDERSFEFWCKCGHPNFEALVTTRTVGNHRLVICTFLTPDLSSAGGASSPAPNREKRDQFEREWPSGQRASTVGVQPYGLSDGDA